MSSKKTPKSDVIFNSDGGYTFGSVKQMDVAAEKVEKKVEATAASTKKSKGVSLKSLRKKSPKASKEREKDKGIVELEIPNPVPTSEPEPESVAVVENTPTVDEHISKEDTVTEDVKESVPEQSNTVEEVAAVEEVFAPDDSSVTPLEDTKELSEAQESTKQEEPSVSFELNKTEEKEVSLDGASSVTESIKPMSMSRIQTEDKVTEETQYDTAEENSSVSEETVSNSNVEPVIEEQPKEEKEEHHSAVNIPESTTETTRTVEIVSALKIFKMNGKVDDVDKISNSMHKWLYKVYRAYPSNPSASFVCNFMQDLTVYGQFSAPYKKGKRIECLSLMREDMCSAIALGDDDETLIDVSSLLKAEGDAVTCNGFVVGRLSNTCRTVIIL